MDEYIKREDALDALMFELAGSGYQSRARDVIRLLPTADVAPMAEWISVEERWPETDGYYLVWNIEQRKIEIRFFHRLPPHYPVETYPEIRAYFGNCADHKSITHWMPLPDPPKGE